MDKIPGGAQLNSKRMKQYSDKYPTHYRHAHGICVDVGGAKNPTLIDFSTMGIGTAILGYNYTPVNVEVDRAISKCAMTSLNSDYELELADKLIEIHPYYDMVRYFKTGGEAIEAAVRVARARTGIDKVISIGYHGWHDWWLAGNIENEYDVTSHLNITTTAGVPSGLRGTNIFCQHNDCDMLLDILTKNDYKIAAIVFEYARYEMPTEKWLRVLQTAQAKGIFLIADEVTTGWRYQFGGMHKSFRDIFTPDMVVYGKAISNGYAFSCVIGTQNAMVGFEGTFISSTYWTESIGMAAALATIKELSTKCYEERNLKHEHLAKELKRKLGAKISGINGLLHYEIPGMKLNEWCDKMLAKGYLVTNNIYLSMAHSWKTINQFIEAI